MYPSFHNIWSRVAEIVANLWFSGPLRKTRIVFPEVEGNPFNSQWSVITSSDEILSANSVIRALKSTIHLQWGTGDNAET